MPVVELRGMNALIAGSRDIDTGHYQRAVLTLTRAVQDLPRMALSHGQLSHAMARIDDIEGSIYHGEIAAALIDQQDQNYSQFSFNLSLSYLAAGEFKKGWPLHHHRKGLRGYNDPAIGKPIWNGRSPGRVLLWSDAGIGDYVQFIRLSKLVKQAGAKIIELTHLSGAILASL